MNEPTTEKVTKLAVEIYSLDGVSIAGDEAEIIAKWHLQQIEGLRGELETFKQQVAFPIFTQRVVSERDTLRTQLAEAQAANGLMRNALIQANEHIKYFYIDWAKLNSASPDYDKDYQPEYPQIVSDTEAIINTKL